MSTFRFPDKPTKATTSVLPHLEDGDWLCQFKPDGWRTLVTVAEDGITLTSRHNEPIPAAPEFVTDVARSLREAGMPSGTILDGEWMGRRDGQSERLYLFDMLQLEGCWIGGEGSCTRFMRLGRQIQHHQTDKVRLVTSTLGDYAGMFADSQAAPGVEGIVLKRISAPYIGSRQRSIDNPNWLKVRWR